MHWPGPEPHIYHGWYVGLVIHYHWPTVIAWFDYGDTPPAHRGEMLVLDLEAQRDVTSAARIDDVTPATVEQWNDQQAGKRPRRRRESPVTN